MDDEQARQELDAAFLEAYQTSSPRIKRRLRKLARARNISVSAVMRLIVYRHLTIDDERNSSEPQ